MKAKLRRTNLLACFNEIYIKNELVNIINTIDNFNELIKNKNMEFEEYIEFISSLYNIELTNYDILKICNNIFEKNCKSIVLNTNIPGVIINQIENNNKFIYKEEEHLLDVNVAFINDNDIDGNYIYNFDDIIKLIKERKIVILDFIINGNSYYDFESNELYPLNCITFDGLTSIDRIDENYIPSFRYFFNNYFTIDKLNKDLNEYISEVKEKLLYLDKYIEDTKNGYNEKIKNYDKVYSLSKKIKDTKINK